MTIYVRSFRVYNDFRNYGTDGRVHRVKKGGRHKQHGRWVF